MRKPRLAIAALCGAGALAPAASAAPLHARYEHAYHAVAHKLGHRAPGRDIVRWGLQNHKPASRRAVVRSLGVLHRMLAPPTPVPLPVASVPAIPAPAPTTPAAPVTGGLTACIIAHESGGNPQAVNGQYTGLGQWSPSAWSADGGTAYSPTPTGASAAEQTTIIERQVAAGNTGQWTNYDGC